MKTFNIKLSAAIAFAAILTFASSCKKYLAYESQSTISQTVAFTSPSYTNTAVIGAYSLLNGDAGLTKEATIWSLAADDFKTSGSYGNGDDRRGISMYGAIPTNSELPSAFNNLYVGIERANICIRGIQNSPLYTSGATGNPEMGRYLGEVLALRSLYHFVLVRNWGSVVAQWVPSSDQPALDVPVTAGTAVLDHVLDDLKTAEDLLPWRSASPFPDTRFSKGAVKALRARIAMFRGGYMMDKASHTMTRSSNYLDYYKIADQECTDLMARRDQHDLNPVYENIFKTLHSTTRQDPTFELMFEIGAYGGGSYTDDKLGYYNGLRFNTSSAYGQGGGGILCIPTYYYEFDQVADCRRDVTINVDQIDANTMKIMNTLTNMTDGKFRKSWTTSTGINQYLSVHWPVIRFADVLLMFAEAENEINQGPTAAAQSALLEIRKRAYVGYASSIPAAPADYASFFQAIVKERLLEFGGEAVRKYDLMRWNLMGSKFLETQTKLRNLMNGVAPYNNVPLYVYNKPTAYTVTNSTQEVGTMDNYGGAPNVSLFQPGLGTSTAPTGYTAYKWRADISEAGAITGTSTGFATFFQSNQKEVFPFPSTVLLQNTKIIQNYGY